MRIGFIGLGSQGGPMARRIIAGGYQTTVWARKPETIAAFTDTAAQIAPSPAALANLSDLICLCVTGDADIEELISRPDGILAGSTPGTIIAVHSTVHPDTCRALAEKADRTGVSVIDAPVSGGGSAAAQGRLLVMCGGDVENVDRCRPVFDTYAASVVHLGELGAGQMTKLLNNLLFTANLATTASTLSLATKLGVTGDRLIEVIARGSAHSFALDALAGSGGLNQLAEHAGSLLRKDVGLVAQLAAESEAGAVFRAADAALSIMGHARWN